ncbi:restriction endonuclease, partial [Candidatus Woesearchaeota archaeon]|nr:restriction endonuclease [Candidatus Woesearchaeota archaeon]
YKFFERNFKKYLGEKFEEFCMKLVKEGLINLGSFTRIGRQWGKIKNKPKGENTYEIDILAINEKTKEILAVECKWKNKVNAEKIAKELVEKLSFVDWHKDKRKESLAIFAKSFSKKIQSYDSRKVYCFDLKDLERIVK